MSQDNININIQETNDIINIVSSETTEVIDINVGETVEEVTLNITEEIIQVNINKVTGGGGNQTLAETLALGNVTGGENIVINNADSIQLENSSTLKKGTYNYGGNGGISRICSNNYEDMWQDGFRHVFDQSGFIRNSTNCFDIVPDSSFDVTLRFKIGSIWTLDNGTNYICTDATEGDAVWELYNVIPTNTSDLTNDSNFVSDASYVHTDNNFTTAEQTKLAGIEVGAEVNVNADWNATSGDAEILNKPSIPAAQIQSDWNQTNNVSLDFIKNKPTIPSISGLVPYTGATSDLDLGSKNLKSNNIFEGFSSIVASGTLITLTIDSVPTYVVTGSGGQTIKLPNATTLPNGAVYYFNNNQSSGAITINNNSNTLIASVPSGGFTQITLLSNAIAAGSWERHEQAPSNVSWSTNTFDYPGSITSATWNGVSIADNRIASASTWNAKQDALVSGTNIKTINSTSVLGSGNISTGTVTSVSALTLGTTGSDLSSSVANGTTTPVITLNVPTASATNRGVLSSADWTTFNNKQNALGYTPYRFSNASWSTVTGTTSKTVVATTTIAANTFNSTDIMKLAFRVSKTVAASSTTIRIEINTTNTITGATIIAAYGMASGVTFANLQRTISINGGTTAGVSASITNIINDFAISSTASFLTTISSYNVANPLYVFFTVQNGATGDSTTFDFANITN